MRPVVSVGITGRLNGSFQYIEPISPPSDFLMISRTAKNSIVNCGLVRHLHQGCSLLHTSTQENSPHGFGGRLYSASAFRTTHTISYRRCGSDELRQEIWPFLCGTQSRELFFVFNAERVSLSQPPHRRPTGKNRHTCPLLYCQCATIQSR